MSATPKVPLVWTGFFDKSGSPALRIKIEGPFGQGTEFEAVLDTGFTGFIAMPLLRALPLGLMLYGTTSVELADGSMSTKLTAKGVAGIEGEHQIGVVILEPSSNDILLGMAFLRLFKKALFVSSSMVLLVSENDAPSAGDDIAEEPENPAPVDSN